jgi:hypothetical protein
MVGFEPTFSSTPSWRIASLSYILILHFKAPSGSRTHASRMASGEAAATSWAPNELPGCQRAHAVSEPRGTWTLTSPVKSRVCCR